MDTRVGYPSEHLAGNTQESVSSPMFATSVGLLMNALVEKLLMKLKMKLILENKNSENENLQRCFKKRKSILTDW